ncbi:phosphatidate cytidylyltransferase [Roseimicrobium gellanilyticum]|uniref:Phosphatidate cytidylyltransferase n=1 Tax=Roseimicrobium gellanilyticum TaxID=748857 RepID=A0A366HQV1_9BACT|nr:phosphatidate cytidylyltransferase [Roseimicrobium gellanilyticum]RBP45303.1 phosphatidate cytidylyltransferase [Roseimicrobium gellanilyticum]
MSAPQSTSQPPSKGKVFVIRLGSTLALWAFITVGLLTGLDWLLLLMIALAGIGTSAEYFRLEARDTKARAYRWVGFGLCVVFWAVMAWQSIPQSVEPPWWLEAAFLAATVQAAFLPALAHSLEGRDTLVRIYFTIFGVIYTALMMGFLARILFMEQAASGSHLLLMAIMVTKFSDMGAYAFGSWFGKHKMIPHISPAKTWEGLSGAFTGAYVAMCSMMFIVPDKLAPLNWTSALILAPILCIAAVIGDLAESVLKRCHSIKDSGHKLPGIGGILDLTDSLLFTAPVCYFYLRVIGQA